MSAPRKPPKRVKRLVTAAELEKILAERAGVPVHKVSVYGEPGNWTATLLANFAGNAERKARLKSLAADIRGEVDLKA